MIEELQLVRVCVAVNSCRNGMFTGWVSAVEVERVFRLEGPVGGPDEADGIHFSYNGEAVRFGDPADKSLMFRHHGYTTWVGNWCCDQFEAGVGSAVELIEFLRSLGGWTLVEAEASLAEEWNAGRPITLLDLSRVLSLYERRPA